jgi:Xaa-Pro aminopeptidase
MSHGIQEQEFTRRRRRLLHNLGGDGIAVLPTAPMRLRNRDVEYPFRPDSNFYYLTGFAEPEAVAVFIAAGRKHRFILFCRERDRAAEIWTGRRAGPHGARRHYGADEAYSIDRLDHILPDLLANRDRIYYTMGKSPEFDERLMAWVNTVRGKARAGVHPPTEFIDLDSIIHEMRLYKSAAEVRTMRHAARISAHAHRRAMLACRPGLMEYQIEAEIIHEFYREGSRAPAYPPIVGGGANGCILHYTENNAALRAGDLLLIDAGAEYDCYAADITRTFPVSGRFSPAQRAVYDIVLEAQAAAIDQVAPGRHWNAPHDAAVRVLTKGLVRLGLLKGTPAKLIKNQAYQAFYMHRTGHWLGMDVHDVGEYKEHDRWRTLKPGMVLTVEPGLYIRARHRGVASKWWNIGIRIEDDVLVTRSGNDILSRDAPKLPDEIESLMGT